MLGLRPNLYDRMLFEHYFEHSSKWTNLLFQLLNSPSVKKKYWRCGQSTYRIWFCSDNFHGSYQVWAYFINNSSRLSLASDINLDIDVLLATNELFKMLLRVWMHGEKHWTALQFLVPNQSFLWNDTPCKGVGLGELSPCSKLSKGPCMDLSLHVPNSYLRVVVN